MHSVPEKQETAGERIAVALMRVPKSNRLCHFIPDEASQGKRAYWCNFTDVATDMSF
jgi:hypothetical protein